MITFNSPYIAGKEFEYINEVIKNKNFCGDGIFTKKCNELLEKLTGCKKVLLTTSCTDALELSALLTDISPGDEVILPSFTFVSTANPFVLRGAKAVFVDIRPDTLNLDENKIEDAVSEKTKAVIPVHYAGVGCEMDKIMKIAEKHNLYVIEDAAQALMCRYKGTSLAAIGKVGCISFHDTKNYHCGEGGAILINDENLIERAEIIREKGTNRSKFLRGEIDRYSWVDIGSSFLPGELNAAFLYAQLEKAEEVRQKRLKLWKKYYDNLIQPKDEGKIELPVVPEGCEHNGHIFYIKLDNFKERRSMIDYLKSNGIQAVFHYIPLHSSDAGIKFGEFKGRDEYTTKESERLLRLPLYYNLTENEVDFVCEKVKEFFKQ